jgi:hypothetical protein
MFLKIQKYNITSTEVSQYGYLRRHSSVSESEYPTWLDCRKRLKEMKWKGSFNKGLYEALLSFKSSENFYGAVRDLVVWLKKEFYKNTMNT